MINFNICTKSGAGRPPPTATGQVPVEFSRALQHSCKGAHHGCVVFAGLEIDPGNEQFQSGIADAQEAKADAAASGSGKARGIGGMFSSPEVMGRLAMNPQTRGLLGQPKFQAMLKDLDRSPDSMNKCVELTLCSSKSRHDASAQLQLAA